MEVSHDRTRSPQENGTRETGSSIGFGPGSELLCELSDKLSRYQGRHVAPRRDHTEPVRCTSDFSASQFTVRAIE